MGVPKNTHRSFTEDSRGVPVRRGLARGLHPAVGVRVHAPRLRALRARRRAPREGPRVVDRKLIARYGVARSKWDRARRKRAGWANVQYLRFGRVFVLVATAGEHEFFRREKGSVRDARRTPIRVGGYAVSVRQGHVHVRIDLAEYRALRAWFWDVAVRRSAGRLPARSTSCPSSPMRLCGGSL